MILQNFKFRNIWTFGYFQSEINSDISKFYSVYEIFARNEKFSSYKNYFRDFCRKREIFQLTTIFRVFARYGEFSS